MAKKCNYVIGLVILSTLYVYSYMMQCFLKNCETCNLRAGECFDCANNYYFKNHTNDPTCTHYQSKDDSITKGCALWDYELATEREYCKRCKVDYYRDPDGKSCTKNSADGSCTTNCATCTIIAGKKITPQGDNTVCDMCKTGFGIAVEHNNKN